MPSQLQKSVKTKVGTFLLEFSAKGLCRVRFPRRHPALKPGLCLQRPGFNRVVSVDLSGYTPFQRKVYRALRKVPAGRTITYGELARRAGYPGASRAVGTAMKKNRLPIIIPCHRVLPSSGGIGAYSAGKKWKRWLLHCEECEDVTFASLRTPKG